MGKKIYITIDDRSSLMDILKDGLDRGLFAKNMDSFSKAVDMLDEMTFPIRIPIEIDNLLELSGNPIVKKLIGSKLKEAVDICLQKVMEAG